jgi:hypothetical protein
VRYRPHGQMSKHGAEDPQPARDQRHDSETTGRIPEQIRRERTASAS